MPDITLAVTQPVLNQVAEGNAFLRQIAIQARSEDINAMLNTASRENRLDLILGNCVRLVVGDNSSIWRSQNNGATEADFDSIYELLSRRPDQGMMFLCEVVPAAGA